MYFIDFSTIVTQAGTACIQESLEINVLIFILKCTEIHRRACSVIM